MTSDYYDRTLAAKKAAASRASEFLTDTMCVGLGTGSTAEQLIPILAERIRAGWQVFGVPSSERVARLAEQAGIPLLSLTTRPVIDVTVDGADEVDPDFNLIKGHGGALLREKVLAQASRLEVIVVDESKLVQRLGKRCALPVEVVPFAWSHVASRIAGMGMGLVTLRGGETNPLRTDNGNFVLDWRVEAIEDPLAVDVALRQIAGVVEHGLFFGLAHQVIVGRPDGTTELLRKRGQ